MSAREEQGRGRESALEAIAMIFKARTPRSKLATGMSSVRVRIQWFYLGSMFFTENTFVSECKDEGKSKTCKKLKSKNKCDKKKAVEECKKTCGLCPDSGRNSNVRFERVFKATILFRVRMQR